MKICRDCCNVVAGMIDFDGESTEASRCRAGLKGYKYQNPVTGEWKMDKLPKCEDLNSTGFCRNYNGHVR